MNKNYWDSFDCQIQCEEYYDSEYHYRKPSPEESLDWIDTNIEDVTIDGEPLDGHYFDRMIEEIPF